MGYGNRKIQILISGLCEISMKFLFVIFSEFYELFMTEEYWKSNQINQLKHLAKLINDYPIHYVHKISMLHVWQGSGYGSELSNN